MRVGSRRLRATRRRPARCEHDRGRDERLRRRQRSSDVPRPSSSVPTVGNRRDAGRNSLFRPCPIGRVGSGTMVEIAAKPHGPYSLALSARLASDATRRFRDGVFHALGIAATLRRRVAIARRDRDDPLRLRRSRREAPLGARARRRPLRVPAPVPRRSARSVARPTHLRGLRPVRTATVAQALLRAVCGQLIDSKTARAHERRVIRALSAPRREPHGDSASRRRTSATSRSARSRRSSCAGSASTSGAAPRSSELCRGLELERLARLPDTDAVVRPDRARARPRPVVGRRRLPRRPRPLRVRARRRPRARQAPARAARPAPSRRGRPRSCSSSTASGPASRASTSSLGFSRGLVPLPAAHAA